MYTDQKKIDKDSPLTWRGLFWLISPLGGLSAVLACYILPSTTPTDTFKQNLVKVDWLGSFTSTIAVVGFMVAVSGPGAYHAGYSQLVISLLSVSGVAFLAFLFIEWKLATLPIIPRKSWTARGDVQCSRYK